MGVALPQAVAVAHDALTPPHVVEQFTLAGCMGQGSSTLSLPSLAAPSALAGESVGGASVAPEDVSGPSGLSTLEPTELSPTGEPAASPSVAAASVAATTHWPFSGIVPGPQLTLLMVVVLQLAHAAATAQATAAKAAQAAQEGVLPVRLLMRTPEDELRLQREADPSRV
jgi:hypothetical protein